MNFKISREDAINELAKEKEFPFAVLMRHGSMTVEYYAPVETDKQTPHLQDELYVIASGTALFFRDGERVDCTTGDVLFVPAGMEHRFEHFSSDFATWVIFYGPSGGEAGFQL